MNHDPTLSYLAQPSRELFTLLVESEQQAVFGAAWRVLGDREAAEDVTQELFMRVLDADWGKRDVRDGRGFLVSQAIGMARTRLRGDQRRGRREKVAAKEERVESDVISGAVLREVRDAILELPEAPRQCVELRYFGGLKASEIATRLGCAVRTVNDRLQDARERLRTRLSAHSAAFLVPLLESDLAPPTVAPSTELALRLEGITQGAFKTSLVATSSSLVGYVLVVSLIAVLTTAGMSYFGGSNAPVAQSPVLLASHFDAGGEVSESEETLAEAGLIGLADEERIESSAPEGIATQTRTALRIRVRDESGNEIKGATFHFKARKLSTMSAVLALDENALGGVPAEIEALLDPILLEAQSEFFVSGFPDSLCDLPFELCGFAPGYATSVPFAVMLVAHGTTEVELRLPRPRRADLRLVDSETELPIFGAIAFSSTELERRDLDPKATWNLGGVGRGMSDAAGRLILDDLGSGVHHIEIVATGYELVVLSEHAPGAGLELRMTPVVDTGRILVHVQDPAGEPITDFPVIITRVASDVELRAQTNSNGVAVFEHLSPDRYEAKLALLPFARLRKARGYASSSVVEKVFTMGDELRAGEDLTLTLGYLPGTARWEVAVVGPRGEPIVGEEVTITGPVQLSLETNADGLCLFEHLPAGAWRLTVGDFLESFSYERPVLADGELRVDRIKFGAARVEGRIVIDETGVIPARAFVMIQGAFVASTHSSNEGKFTLNRVSPGEYTLHCFVPGYAVSVGKVRVEVGSEIETLEVRLVRGGSLIVDRAAAWMATGSRLDLRDSTNGELAMEAVEGTPTRSKSPLLLPGVYTLTARAPGRESFTTQVVIENGSDSFLVID